MFAVQLGRPAKLCVCVCVCARVCVCVCVCVGVGICGRERWVPETTGWELRIQEVGISWPIWWW